MSNKYSLKISLKSAQDLNNIFEYIAFNLSNPIAAVNHINDFQTAFDRICELPYSCPKIDNEYVKDKSLRKTIVNNYIVFYRVNDNKQDIEIIRVLYGMRNFEKIL